MPRREIRDWCQEVGFDELSSTGERVYVRLRMAADSAGRFYGAADLVLNKCFSCRVRLSVEEVEMALCELEGAGLVVRYVVEGGRFLAIVDWGVRQRSVPRFPAPVPDLCAGEGVVDVVSRLSVDCQSIVSQVSDACQSGVSQVSDKCQSFPLSPSSPPAPPLSSPAPPYVSAQGRVREQGVGLGGGLVCSGVDDGEAAPPQVPVSGESGDGGAGRDGVVDGLLNGVNVFRASELPFKDDSGVIVPQRVKRCAGGGAFDVPGCVEEVMAVMRGCLHFSEADDERVQGLATDFYEHYKDGRTAGGGLLKNWRYKAQVWLQENARKWQRERLKVAQQGPGVLGRGVREDIVLDGEGF